MREGDHRWQAIEDIFRRAVELPPASRGAFLDDVCAADEALRRELEFRLAQEAENGAAFAGPPHLSRLGPYEILGRIGAGGMGAVHRARDTRVDRIVAVKICHAHLAGRFEKEARAIAALNHPHICALHDLGHEGGIDYLVMEYVEGESLAARLAQGRLPAGQAIRYAIEIADALAAAHARGIVHRDLKPANIMVTKAGVKVLDFGLAKTTRAAAASTVAATTTLQGLVLGTPHYMSPEQAQGQEIDARSDIFSFGLVFYEMLTGRRAFDGPNAASVMAGILEREPPPVEVDVPPAARRLLLRCLAKDPDERWHAAHDLKTELEWIEEGAPQAPPRSRSRTGWLAAALFAAVAAAALVVHLRQTPPAHQVVQFQISSLANHPFDIGDKAAASPDGRRIVFSAGRRLFVRSLDSPSVRELPGTEGGVKPFWSADGRYVAYEAYWKLMKVSLIGGPPVFLCDVFGSPGGAWSRDGTILFPANGKSGLMRISEGGGKPVPVTKLDTAKGEISHAWPSFLPDGKHFLFTVYAAEPANGGVFLGSTDSPQRSRFLPEQSNAEYTEPGYILFSRGSNLMAQAFDAGRLRLTGDVFPVTEGVAQGNRSTYRGFSAAAGVLVYGTGGADGPKRLRLVDRKGSRLADVGPPANFWDLALSPDGHAVAAGMPTDAFEDIWVFDLIRGTRSRVTLGQAGHSNPKWSPDGREIAFVLTDPSGWVIKRVPANGTGKEERLVQLDRNAGLSQWTPDGRFLILQPFGSGKPGEVWAARLSDLGNPFPLLTGPFNIAQGRVSPDGKWIAYTSDATGRNEIYVQDFPPKTGKWQISTAGGAMPQWRSDGRELFYREGSKMISVDVKSTAAGFEAGLPKSLFDPPVGVLQFDVSADGRKFLLVVPNEGSGPSQTFTVVLNWPSAIKP